MCHQMSLRLALKIECADKKLKIALPALKHCSNQGHRSQDEQVIHPDYDDLDESLDCARGGPVVLFCAHCFPFTKANRLKPWKSNFMENTFAPYFSIQEFEDSIWPCSNNI